MSAARIEMQQLWSIRVFLIRAVLIPVAGAAAFGGLLTASAHHAWGATTALLLLTFWVVCLAVTVWLGHPSWNTIALASVLPLTIAAFGMGTATQEAATAIGIGLSTMYLAAKTRCVFLGCCDVRRGRNDGKRRSRSLHLGYIEASISLVLIGIGVVQLWTLPASAFMPLILAHGILRVYSAHARKVRRTDRLRAYGLLAATGAAQFALVR